MLFYRYFIFQRFIFYNALFNLAVTLSLLIAFGKKLKHWKKHWLHLFLPLWFITSRSQNSKVILNH